MHATEPMDDARKAVQMFTAGTPLEARAVMPKSYIPTIPSSKEADKNITEEALAIIENDGLLRASKIKPSYFNHTGMRAL